MDPEKKGVKFFKHINLENIFIALTILLGIIVIINIVFTYSLNKDLKKSVEIAQEKLKPAKIELTLIKNSKCTDCFDISTIVSHVKNAKVDITKEKMFEFDSNEGKEIINKYKIEKIPTVIVTGELDKFVIQGLERKENALLLTKVDPPFTNALTGKIEGRVTLYHLKDSSCEKCNDLNPLINQIKNADVKISEEKVISPNSDEGKELLNKYNIDFVPTIILSKDAAVYDLIEQAWPQIGTKEEDGAYVFRGGVAVPNLPHINLTTGNLKGLVDVVYLTDKSCAECYNVNQHKLILIQNFGIKLDKEETIDVSDAKGKELIAKYNISLVPTIVLSDEASAYPSSQVLKQFFSVEKDGSFIFRQLVAVGTYKDMTTNQIVQAQQQNQQ